MGAASGLRDLPWSSATRALEERGVRWLYGATIASRTGAC